MSAPSALPTAIANWQDVAIDVGMDHSRFTYRFPDRGGRPVPSYVWHYHNRCILCTRCVRVCDEVEGAHVMGCRESRCGLLHHLGS